MTCIKCGKELPAGAAFCPACGKKQQKPKRKTKSRGNGLPADVLLHMGMPCSILVHALLPDSLLLFRPLLCFLPR